MIFSFYVSGIHDAKRSFHLIRGWTTSLRILWLLVPRFVHATSTISLSLRPLRARSSFVRDAQRALVLYSCGLVRSFSPQENGQPFLLSLSVALSYQIDELVGRRKKECWISDLCDRESVDAKNSSVSPFVSTVAGTYIGFAVEQASIWDGSRLFTTGEQKNWRVEGLFFLIRILFIFCFFELRIVIFSRERIRLRTMELHTGRKERLSRFRYYSE